MFSPSLSMLVLHGLTRGSFFFVAKPHFAHTVSRTTY